MNFGLPFGTLVSRYLLIQNLSSLAMTTSFCVGIALVVEFLQRSPMFIQYEASAGLIFKYILFKAPWYVSNILPIAYLLSVLLTLSRLTKQNELVAMRSGGISLRQITQVILSAAVLVSIFTFIWNEWVVPWTFTQSERTRRIEIQKKDFKGVRSNQGVWVRGDGAFYHFDLFDRHKGALSGIRVFRLDREFHLIGVVEAKSARWTGKEWLMKGTRERVFLPRHKGEKGASPSTYRITEPMEEFNILSRKREEFRIFELRDYISTLRRKGMDVRSHEIDLQIKLSTIFIPLVMAIIAIPFTLRNPRMGGVAASFSMSIAIGFSFWIIQAIGISLARGGAMHPYLAGWLPHLIFSLTGFYYLLGVEE